MAKTNAERQAEYRKRHLESGDGDKTRMSLFLDVAAKARIERIARHKSYTVTQLIGEWAEQAENRILARMSSESKKEYFSENND